MASKSVKLIGRVLFWRYRRGSWQYDILCALILAFIFLTPKEVFHGTFLSNTEIEEDLKEKNEAEKEPPDLGSVETEEASETDQSGR